MEDKVVPPPCLKIPVQTNNQECQGCHRGLDSLLEMNFYRVQWLMWQLAMEQPWLAKEKNMWRNMYVNKSCFAASIAIVRKGATPLSQTLACTLATPVEVCQLCKFSFLLPVVVICAYFLMCSCNLSRIVLQYQPIILCIFKRVFQL